MVTTFRENPPRKATGMDWWILRLEQAVATKSTQRPAEAVRAMPGLGQGSHQEQAGQCQSSTEVSLQYLVLGWTSENL